MITRRQFLKASSLTGVAVGALERRERSPYYCPAGRITRNQPAAGIAASPNLKRWLDKLPIPPVLTPNTTNTQTLTTTKFRWSRRLWQFHSQLDAAPSWGYWAGFTGIGYLGPTIVAQQGRPVVVKYTNNLPSTHLLSNSIDTGPCTAWKGYRARVARRAAPARRIYCASVRWSPGCLVRARQFAHFPVHQPAAGLYVVVPRPRHGHHCLNVYAGLAALYLLRDDNDTGVVDQGLNIPKGEYEVPIVIQDKLFNHDGSMFYPTTSDLDDPYPHPIWEPEFFGDTPVVNAKAYPYLEVEPRRYRLRFVNGSQARFYNLSFVNRRKAVPFNLIGMEQSLLPNKSVQLTHIVLAPAERADIIIDFANVPFGTTLTLANSANIPYPDGDEDALTQIMQFRVNVQLKSKDTTTPAGRLVLPAIRG